MAKGRFRLGYDHVPSDRIVSLFDESGVLHHKVQVVYLPVPRVKRRTRAAEQNYTGLAEPSKQLASDFWTMVHREWLPQKPEPVIDMVQPILCYVCKQGPGVHQECLRRMQLAKMKARFA